MALTKIKTGSVSDSITLTTPTIDGVLTANAGVVVDNFTLDGTTLALSSGNMTLDVAGDINLDSDSGYVLFKDAGTEHARIYQNNSGDVNIASQISDKDIKFNGNDGGTGITALTLDMSAAGAATFNGAVGIGTVPAKPLHVKTTADGTLQRWTRSGICDWDVSIGNTPIISGGSAGDLEIMPTNANMGFAVGRAGQTGINMRVRDGTLTLGSGIKFNSDTAAANELNDYEEGSWTPACTMFTISSIPSAKYTKIGNQVTLQMYIEIAANSGNSSSVLITGLPFACASNGWSIGGVNLAASNANLNNAHVRVFSGSTSANIKKNNDTTVAGNEIDASHLILTATYFTDS